MTISFAKTKLWLAHHTHTVTVLLLLILFLISLGSITQLFFLTSGETQLSPSASSGDQLDTSLIERLERLTAQRQNDYSNPPRIRPDIFPALP